MGIPASGYTGAALRVHAKLAPITIKIIQYFLKTSLILKPMGVNVACSLPVCQFSGEPLFFWLPPGMILFHEAAASW
jgi:hypothetical protein